jgi:hypothetical protein
LLGVRVSGKTSHNVQEIHYPPGLQADLGRGDRLGMRVPHIRPNDLLRFKDD